jgi:three-Cys-motif partner protein
LQRHRRERAYAEKRVRATKQSSVQVFGGQWSLLKLDMLERYFRFFNTALKRQPFRRVYIDAFAGSGNFQYTVEPEHGLFADETADTPDVHSGSAKRALQADPPFGEIIFIEQNGRLVRSLEALIATEGHANARVEHGDANTILRKICQPANWKRRRGITFLDPFGMSVDWSTLELIAKTQALDLWFLFSIAGLVRNLPRSANRLDASKRSAVTRVLGTDEWFDEFYKVPTSRLFRDAMPLPARRTASLDQIEAYVLKRLRTIFPHVEEPRRLRTPKNHSLFSLFFAVSNPNPKAITLARKGAAHILKTGR